MGELARRLLGSDRDRIVDGLVHAYADEWFAHYNFLFVAHTLRGHRSPSVIDFLHRRAADALARANRMAARIVQLGGTPPSKLPELTEHASDKPFKLPASTGDTVGVLLAVLDAERTSIRTFHDLAVTARDADPVTYRIAVDYLAAAEADEEALERLLDETAPHMDGT